MKTTLEIRDSLLSRAKDHARLRGSTLRAVVEEGLRRVLDEPVPIRAYAIQDCRVGNGGASDPLEGISWQDLRGEIYGDRR